MKETENLVFTSIDIDTLIERIAERLIKKVIINEGNEGIRKLIEVREILKMSVFELEISLRLYNCLRYADIRTLEDLINCTETDLMRLRNFGVQSLDEVKNLLERYGLTLKETK